MYYIYFPYVLLLSLILLGEFIEKKQSKLWALIVLFAPVTAPYFIFRAKKEEGITWIMIFIASFSAVIAGETALYVFKKEKLKYFDQPPVIRETLHMADKLQKTTQEFDSVILQLEERGRIISGLDKIGETIDYIGKVRQAGNKNKEMVSKLINHIEHYRNYYTKKDVTWIFQIEEYYNNNVIRMHLDSFEGYLNAFENVLSFSYKNFYQISELEDPKFRRNYDAYYLKYRRASEKFSKYNMSRNKFQTQFVLEHPKVKAYLPGVRQTNLLSSPDKSPIRFF